MFDNPAFQIITESNVQFSVLLTFKDIRIKHVHYVVLPARHASRSVCEALRAGTTELRVQLNYLILYNELPRGCGDTALGREAKRGAVLFEHAPVAHFFPAAHREIEPGTAVVYLLSQEFEE